MGKQASPHIQGGKITEQHINVRETVLLLAGIIIGEGQEVLTRSINKASR